MTSRTLPAFSDDELQQAHLLLAQQVVQMDGRKLEEGDWSHAYCGAKGIPEQGWSNLSLDVVHAGLGIEHKMLCKDNPAALLGTRQMHPAATRSIRIVPEGDPNEVMHDVLGQYGELIESRRQVVANSSSTGEADVRFGWLLWQRDLAEFVYFEEPMIPPDPEAYFAQWSEREQTGRRKPSKNLWIFEKDTRIKRYSVTTSAGAKIQPYFDVPPGGDPNVYVFRIQGFDREDGSVGTWIREQTRRELESLLGSVDPATLGQAIIEAAAVEHDTESGNDVAAPIELSIDPEAYDVLKAMAGLSDDARLRGVVARLLSVRDVE